MHTYSYAQLQGKITDTENTPLEYATVSLFNQKDSTLVTGTITNAEGFFQFEEIQLGNYYLKASFIGFESKFIYDIEITTISEVKKLATLQLNLGNELNEIIIKSDRKTLVNQLEKQIYDAKTFKNTQGGTATDILQNLPSVSINGLGEISVRGSTGFVVLLNGKPLQGDASLLINQLPANSVERVELITTPSAKYDPEGKAGLINIITKKGAINGSFAQVNVKGGLPSIETYGNTEAHQRYGVDATYNLQKEDWNFSFGANYQRNDLGGRREGNVFTIINDTLTQFPSSGERSFDEEIYSGNVTIDYTPTANNDFSLGFYAGKRSKVRLADIVYYDNNARFPAPDGNRIYSFQYFNHNSRERKGDFILGSLDYSHQFKDSSQLSASFLHEYTLLGGPTVNQNLGYPNNDILYQDEYNTNENPLNGTRLQIDYDWKAFNFGKISTGYQYRNLDHTGDFIYERRTSFDEDFQLVPEFSSEVNLRRTIHSGYFQIQGQKNQWQYATGIRLEVMNRELDLKDKSNTIDTTYTYDFVKAYPSASVQYSISKTLKLKAAYSKRVERTTTFKMNPFPEREHSETLEQGDPNLKPEFIDVIELGMTKKLKGGNSIFATAYFRNTENLVNRVNTIFNDTILNRIYSNVGRGKSFGLELGTEFKPTENWSNFIGGNIYNYQIEGEFDSREIKNNATVYSINANSTYRFLKNASLQFTFNYLSSRNTAQGEDSRFYSPNLTLQKSFFNNQLTATLQWKNIDLGWLDTNEQRITTFRPNEFYTTTNYIYEVDMLIFNLAYTFSNGKNNSKFIESEFGKNEF